MLRITASSHSSVAKNYFTAKAADYFIDGQEQELAGIWQGKGAALLGLSGTISQKDWHALCDNINPQTGKTLTARQKQERRVGYDFTFSVPKSVSVVYGLTGDERLLDAFRASVRETMEEIEAEVETRVRKSGKDENRVTGNAIWGEHTHFTSRPVDGVPDPHLHSHCFVLNASYDDQEKRWKAIQIGDQKADAPYFEARFLARLGQKLRSLGLDTERTAKGWELQGFSLATVKKFSRRTEEIESLAKAKGIEDPDVKGELGAKTRSRKAKNLTLDQLRSDWASRLTSGERDSISMLVKTIGGAAISEDRGAARDVVVNAADHLFERKSTVSERTLLAEAWKRSAGKASIEAVEDQYRRQGFLSATCDKKTMVTTREVLAQEQAMLTFARDGRGACRSLGREPYEFRHPDLSAGQRNAVEHVLRSRDRVMLIRGAAGVGKTTMMQEARDALELSGHRVFAFAPPAKASRGVLREKGFENADTVAKLLADEKLQEQVRGQVIWIDEAGLVGTRTMVRIFQLAEQLNARLILSGDRFQHGSVEAGSPLRLLETEAGLVPATITEIQRQKHEEYMRAIEALSEGRSADGFKALNDLGWIREVPTDERYRKLAAEYLATVAGGETALVVSPTHREGDKVTREIREGLKTSGQLGEEHELPILVCANLTEAERRDSANYVSTDVLLFHQNAKGFRKGQQVLFDAEHLPMAEAARFQVYRQRVLKVAVGETLRITKNGKSLEGKNINNGDLVKVRSFNDAGDLVTDKGTISKSWQHVAYGYCLTSMASQGTDVHRVFVAQGWDSIAASSREQFYVSASRGIRSAVFYTDNKSELMEAVKKTDVRLSATELLLKGQGRPPVPSPSRTEGRQREAERAYG
ncbi:Multifunctional conjugation protein TraI [Caulifigura coniformis]|uniref:Multifunctional conjugation protein TraI n=1 Tax=Caulifigura coniformis TaxID=2527983 RepID=A0A517SA65_9PLAN|nr:MobF family relaxase [Caulifigura coniformis]QDT53003.1 Multifunctional conjugation protein TraI [Caulifigura coniformis]